jgi:hypothetical protein
VAAALPPLVGAAWNMPAVGLATNCGGYNAARAYVRMTAIIMSMFADDSANETFSLETATPAQLQELARCFTAGWGVQDGDIWITKKPLRSDANDRQQIVALCSRPFKNVPQYMFRWAPPSHAVAFSDGSTALISTGEFEALDRSAFTPLNEISPAPK